jgi:hypothetical protein
MESSANEYVSFYVAGRLASDPLGTMSVGTAAAPGIATGFAFFRAGDYGGISVDPTDGLTFWAANEYAGTDPVFNTALASFKILSPNDLDFYSFSASDGHTVNVTVSLPGSSTGAQFVNNLSPTVELFDPNGNLVASGTTSLSYTVPTGGGGTYAVAIAGANGTEGEYVLNVQDPPKAAHHVSTPRLSGAYAVTGLTSLPTGGNHVAVSVLGSAAAQPSSHLSPTTLNFLAQMPAVTTAVTQSSANETQTASSPTRPSQGSIYASDSFFVLFGRGSQPTEEESVFSSLSSWWTRIADESERESSLR